ncbi:unnamed protein product [Prorocentrum cordatum]|uniref:Cleavage and polyadenylation specificity factor subunit 4 n=1 Tax=Prorocentrum cordatum TaxID=2364126 RepID=A0ABN9THM8_9DINO|nr:unnamed protein product [Polarella glacialis]
MTASSLDPKPGPRDIHQGIQLFWDVVLARRASDSMIPAKQYWGHQAYGLPAASMPAAIRSISSASSGSERSSMAAPSQRCSTQRVPLTGDVAEGSQLLLRSAATPGQRTHQGEVGHSTNAASACHTGEGPALAGELRGILLARRSRDCFACGEPGHIAMDCPNRGKPGFVELCGDFKRGTCTRGSACRFSHGDAAGGGDRGGGSRGGDRYDDRGGGRGGDRYDDRGGGDRYDDRGRGGGDRDRRGGRDDYDDRGRDRDRGGGGGRRRRDDESRSRSRDRRRR